MKTYIYFKSGNVYQIDPKTVCDVEKGALLDLIKSFVTQKNYERWPYALQAKYIAGDGTTGTIFFCLTDVETIEQMR